MRSLLAFVPSEEHTLTGHPENANRLAAVARLLDRRGMLAELSPVEPNLASEEQLGRVHSAALIDRVRQASQHGLARLDADTYVTPASYSLARLAAGGVCAAVDEIMAGRARNGIAIVRPPGHHAASGRVGGFCLFNNVAVAARHVQAQHHVSRVLILDFDVHHGNGTQEIFYCDPSVLTVSLHMYHRYFYPGTGAAHEIGDGSARGLTLNVPFQPGVGDQGYDRALRELILPKAMEFRPEFVLVSAGFDAHWIDPLAAAGLSLSGYAQVTRAIIRLAEKLCQGRVLFVLEGGYHLDALSYGVLNVTYALTGRDEIEDPLGPMPDSEADVSQLLYHLQALHLLI